MLSLYFVFGSLCALNDTETKLYIFTQIFAEKMSTSGFIIANAHIFCSHYTFFFNFNGKPCMNALNDEEIRCYFNMCVFFVI